MHTYLCNQTQMLKAAPEPNWRTAVLMSQRAQKGQQVLSTRLMCGLRPILLISDKWCSEHWRSSWPQLPAPPSPRDHHPCGRVDGNVCLCSHYFSVKAVYQSTTESGQIWPCLQVQTLFSVLCWGVAEERDQTPVLRHRREQIHINGWDHSGGRERDWVGDTKWHWAARRATPTEGNIAQDNQPDF